jgi:glycosyltransferase involved in cell wall biosynthesis
MAPKLTVVTPTLNQGAFIERTITSVLDQGYENLEYVIVDGGSTDDTVEIVKRYEDRLAWWVSEPDDGQTDAINKGIARTDGEIVAFINSDDYYLPGAFEHAVATLEGSDTGWMAGASRFDSEEGQELHIWRPEPPESVEGPLGGRQWWAFAPWGVPQPSSFWRRRMFESYGPFRPDMHYVFDTEFNLRLAYAGEMPALSDEVMAVRVLQGAAKSADLAPFVAEARKLPGVFRSQLSGGERARMPVTRALTALGRWR